jgi:glucose dehydrogenase
MEAREKVPNLFANCVIALNAQTGKRIWHFQTVHHDLWDRDIPCPPNLITVKHQGKMVDAVAQATKDGYIFVFDRDTGKPLFPVKEVPAPCRRSIAGRATMAHPARAFKTSALCQSNLDGSRHYDPHARSTCLRARPIY